MIEKYYGILASVDWNSNHWQELPSKEDLTHSNYGYVVEENYTHTFLNFAHEIYHADDEGFYYGLLPQMWSKSPDKEKVRYVEIVFIKSQNWMDKQNYIIGFYAFPAFGRWIRNSPVASFQHKLELNVKALPKDIHLLKHHLCLSSDPGLTKAILPAGKQLGKQGYNYLTKENVCKVLDLMTTLNPNDAKLSGIKFRVLQTILR